MQKDLINSQRPTSPTRHSLRYVGAAAVLLVVLGALIGISQLLFPNTMEKALSGQLRFADGTYRAVEVTVRGNYTQASTLSQEEMLRGGQDGGVFMDGILLARNVPFSDPASAFGCIEDTNTHVILAAGKGMEQILAEFYFDAASGQIVEEGEGELCLLLAPASDEAEGDALIETFLAQPDALLWRSAFQWEFETP